MGIYNTVHKFFQSACRLHASNEFFILDIYGATNQIRDDELKPIGVISQILDSSFVLYCTPPESTNNDLKYDL